MRLILMRHGETLWNVEHRLQGHDNSELSERGIRQAREFVPYVRALLPAHVVSSDLGRTRQTVGLIGYPDAPSDARLRELDMGEWTGRRKRDLIAEQPERYRAWRAGTFTPDNGETWGDFRARVAAGSGTGCTRRRGTCWRSSMAASFAPPAMNSSACRRRG
jgi:broad specificity phosphatase PhoE